MESDEYDRIWLTLLKIQEVFEKIVASQRN